MKSAANTIGSFELFSILYLSRLVAFLTYSLSLRGEIDTGDRPFMVVFFLLFSLIVSIPSLLVSDSRKHIGLIAQARCISDNFAKAISLLYALFFLWYASASEARFDIFASTLMFSQSDITLYIVILTLCAVYGAYKGIEAIGRASVIFLFFLVFSLAFIVVTITSKFEILNMTPPFYNGVTNIVFNGFSSAVRTVEPLSLMIIAPQINGNIRKGFYKWLLLFFITAASTFTLIGGVTGSYGNMQLFQMFTLTVLSGFSIFERLDALLSGLWVLCALIKLAFFIYIAVLTLEQGFAIKLKKAPYIIAGMILFSVSTALSYKIEIFRTVINSSAIDISTLFFSVGVPLFVFFAYRAKNRNIQRRGIVTC